jgi:hypothetical protein
VPYSCASPPYIREMGFMWYVHVLMALKMSFLEAPKEDDLRDVLGLETEAMSSSSQI